MYHNFVGSDLWGDIHGSNYRQTQVIKHHRHTQINKAAVTLSTPNQVLAYNSLSNHVFTMHWTLLALGLAQNVAAVPSHGLMARQFATASMLRFQCSQLVIDRIDPLVQPGIAPSTHMHQIVGGNAFNVSMPAESLDPSLAATCTTCDFSEDLSNYWTANLYFRARNGTFKRVPQMVNLGLNGREGVTVYYIPPYDGKSTVTAFPKVLKSWSDTCIDILITDTRASACSSATPGYASNKANKNNSATAASATNNKTPLAARPAPAQIHSTYRSPHAAAASAPPSHSPRKSSPITQTILTSPQDAGTAKTSTAPTTKTTSPTQPAAPSNPAAPARPPTPSKCPS
jgi:hypothetical protein